jgi:PilZ domain
MKRANERRVRLPRDAFEERRASNRFALTLEVHYTVSGLYRPKVCGSGSTIDLSSSGLYFAADKPLLTGQKLHLSIDWPVLLDGGVQLQLAMSGVVVRTNGTAAALQIQRREFRARRSSALNGLW